MKLPGLVIALLAVALPACTCSPSDPPGTAAPAADARAPAQTAPAQAASAAASAAAPAGSGPRRHVFKRVEGGGDHKRPLMYRMEHVRTAKDGVTPAKPEHAATP